MKKLLIAMALILQYPVMTEAQQALRNPQNIISPEINPDNIVTFRCFAPDARAVSISGDWLPADGWVPGKTKMTKGSDGIWSYTSPVLPSELYSYYFLIDGIRNFDLNNVYLVRDVATVSNIFIVSGGRGDLYKVNNVPHGTVARRWYESPSLGLTRRITIYTPPGYEQSNEKYPVLYLLHGMGGDEEAWISLGRAAQILDNLIAQHKATPMIVVMPNGNAIQEAAPGESSLGMYKPGFQLPKTMGGEFEESFPDVKNFVETNYRVKAEKSGRAIAGLSMGGFHSLHISRYYPDLFDYVGLFSAAIMPFEGTTSKVYENMEVTLKNQMSNGFKLYWIGMGRTDFLYKACADYRAKLDTMHFPYTYRESDGGHTWMNWRIYLSEFVPLLFK